MKINFTINIKKIGKTEANDSLLDDKLIMQSLKNFCDKLKQNLEKYLKESKMPSFITYEIAKEKEEVEKENVKTSEE